MAAEVDALIYPAPWTWNLAKKIHIQDRIKIVGKPILEIKRAIAVRKGNVELLNTINPILKNFIKTDKYKEIYTRWYGTPQRFLINKRIFMLIGAFLIALILFVFILKYKTTKEQNKIYKETIKLKQHIGTLLNSSINEIYFFDRNSFKFISSSKGAMDNLGYSQDELNNLTAYDIKPEFSRETFIEAIKPLIEKQENLLVFETIHQRKDGTTYPVEVHLQLIDADNENSQFMAIVLDISKHQIAELTLRQSEEHFRNLLESTSAIPWELDLETWLFTYVGPQIENVSGFKPEEWYAENFWTDHLHPDDKERSVLFCTEATARCEDHEFEYRFIKKDGNIIWIRDAVQVVTKDGKPVILRGFMFDITEQKKEQKVQISTESSLAEAQNIAHIGSWDFDIIANELMWSEETFRIFEINPALVKPSFEGFINIIHPDDRERVQQVYDDSLKYKLPYDIEHRLLMSDGRIKFVNERCDTEYNEQGKAVRSYGTVQDISERKRTDLAIQTIASSVSSTSGDDFYQQLVTNMAEVFNADYAFIGLLDEYDLMLVNTYMVYAHGKIVPNMSYHLDGTPCKTVVGKEACAYPNHVQQLFPEDKMLVDMGVNSYIGIPLYTHEGKAIGLVVVLDSKPMKNAAQMEEVLKIFAARTEAELERKKSNETIQQLSLAVEQSPNNIIITDANGKVEYVNPSFIETTGYSPAEILKQNMSILSAEENSSELFDDLWKTIKSGETWTGVFHNKRSNGEIYLNDAKISPIKNAQGEITHFVGVQSDVTDKKQMEEQLRRSQKMDALGKLTGGIAHDYNNMLNVIIGYTELMELFVDSNDTENIKNYIKEIQNASDRGAKLTKKLLSFSRQEAAEPEEVNLNQLLLDDQDMLSKTLTARINLKYELAEETWPVYLDKGDLEDAILNMCINAMHAMEDSGELVISTFNRHLSSVDAAVMNLSEGDYIQFSLRDNGCGIDEQTLNQIFDPFFTTKGELGSGLGLTQVYGFAKRAKGAIMIDSNVNEGTYISLYFPRHYSEGEIPEVKNDDTFIQSGSETVLVVDDETSIRTLAYELLKSKGYNVLVAESGKEALELLENNNIDLMVSDVVMPNMDGYKLSAKVRESYPKVKIQLISGYNDDRSRTDEDQALTKTLLHKPFKAKQLFKTVRSRLDEALLSSSE